MDGFRAFKGLSLSDKTNVVMTVLNLVALIAAVVSILIAVKSYNIAAKSYQGAQESGRHQQKTLDASKDALLSVVGTLKEQQGIIEDSRHAIRQSIDIMAAQQTLLQQSVETSRNQLAVLDAQWKRELEQPDFHAILLYPTKPAVIVKNMSNIKPLKDGLYQLITQNIDRWLDNRYQLVQTKVTKVDSIRPAGAQFPSTLELILDPNEPLKKGDRLYGYLALSCAECIANRMYWVLIKYGEAGWYAEISETDSEYSIKALATLNPSTTDGHIRSFLYSKRPVCNAKRTMVMRMLVRACRHSSLPAYSPYLLPLTTRL